MTTIKEIDEGWDDNMDIKTVSTRKLSKISPGRYGFVYNEEEKDTKFDITEKYGETYNNHTKPTRRDVKVQTPRYPITPLKLKVGG